MLYFVHCRFPQLCSQGIIISRQDAGSDDCLVPNVAFEFRKQQTRSFPLSGPSAHPGNVAERNHNYTEVIILSYDKMFPEQNNLLFEFQTHMRRNHNFLCGGQLSSTDRMRGIMPSASAFGTMPVPRAATRMASGPSAWSAPQPRASRCESEHSEEAQPQVSVAPALCTPGKWRAGPLAGSHRWEALVSLWPMEDLHLH